ncbi:NADH dehydrogenase [ubiquinone] 1 alpha subcomplex subunit 2 [Acropora cervicornis]|uniref:NADH dehydrogenase [ubiquinone] 1 alpha subcomplex subunit 2 n=1 Tax=Acropora cervicornis TaxID=6130 RepID=A0AAD9UT34_ACRCE|nr:NADH dehydrogenase [ubiquinone] 1 alpha subcomplex subunit 2 [Acropora cervicornis]
MTKRIAVRNKHTNYDDDTNYNMAAAWRSRLGEYVREIRIHLCQKSLSSQGTRDFLEKYYIGLKKDNPKFPILVRECSGIQPKMYARYAYGKETSVQLNNLTSDGVLQAMEKLVTSEAL